MRGEGIARKFESPPLTFGFRDLGRTSRRLPVHPRTVVDPLNEDGCGRRVQYGQESVVADTELPLVGSDQAKEVPPRISGSQFKLPNDPSGHGGIEPAKVAGGGL